MHVNNGVYETHGDSWWRDDAGFEYTSLRYCVNPVRYGFFRRILQKVGAPGNRVLDIGCGGGFLSESFAKDGFEVTGIDPASASIAAATCHARENGLLIDYRVGRGESLPFPDACFDIVACCDVLEHVDDVGLVIVEAARTLKAGGLFLYDTVNRTTKSKWLLIKVWQDWGLVGLPESNMHVWEKFIKPEELVKLMRSHGLRPAGKMKGISPRRNPLALAWAFISIRRGRIPAGAMGPALGFHEGDDLGVSYMGYALKELDRIVS